LAEVPTPASILHLNAVVNNCDRMLHTTKKNGITLRPMTKTHKTIEGLLIQILGSEGIKRMTDDKVIDVQNAPIDVSTMGEAEFYAQAGFKNILYPYPPTEDKLKRGLALMKSGVKMTYSLDNLEVLSNFIAFWDKHSAEFSSFPYTRIPVFIDVAAKEHRTGVNPEGSIGIELAKKISASKYLTLFGVYVHGGFSYQSVNPAEIEAAGLEEKKLCY